MLIMYQYVQPELIIEIKRLIILRRYTIHFNFLLYQWFAYISKHIIYCF